jgi:hypothetical protein
MGWAADISEATGKILSAFAHTTPITYTQSGQTPVVFNPATGDPPHAIFEAEYRLVNLGEGDVPLDSTEPVLFVRTIDLPTPPARDDGVVIDGTNYRVSSVQPDGQGHIPLILRKA